MWLRLALVVWLWGLALYLAAYYFAVWAWNGDSLAGLLGREFYEAHIPHGGWQAVVMPTIAFLVTLALAGAARRPIAALAEWMSHRVRLSRHLGLAVCNLLLIGIAVPVVHGGIVGLRTRIDAAIERAAREAAEQREADVRSFYAYYAGEGMKDPVSYTVQYGMGGERIVFGAGESFRRSTWGCMGSDNSEGRFERSGELLLFDPPLQHFLGTGESASRLREVCWGPRTYLLLDDAQAIRAFCAEVNAGFEPRFPLAEGVMLRGSVLLRAGDERLEVEGLPALPEPLAQELLPEPLEGHTVEVAASGCAWVDLGAQDGLHAGMGLFYLAPVSPAWQQPGLPAATQESLEVLEVEARRCRVRAVTKQRVPIDVLVTSRAPVEPICK